LLDMEGVAVEGTRADLEAVVIAADSAVVIAADSAVAARLASQVDTPLWAVPAATPVDTTADLTTLLTLDIQPDFAVAMPAGASHTDTQVASLADQPTLVIQVTDMAMVVAGLDGTARTGAAAIGTVAFGQELITAGATRGF
jgi:hypothetical protein